MCFIWDKWKIQSDYHGYTIYKRKGSQWHPDSYLQTLRQAVNELNDTRIRTETLDCVVDHVDKTSIPSKTAYLLQRVDEISQETYDVVVSELDGGKDGLN